MQQGRILILLHPLSRGQTRPLVKQLANAPEAIGVYVAGELKKWREVVAAIGVRPG
jgi:hypothetical protein